MPPGEVHAIDKGYRLPSMSAQGHANTPILAVARQTAELYHRYVTQVRIAARRSGCVVYLAWALLIAFELPEWSKVRTTSATYR